MATKILAVRGPSGAGKKTLIGRLVYSCGLGLHQLEGLERVDPTSYADIVRHLAEKGEKLSFHAPAVKVTVDGSEIPDFLFWVVDAKTAVRDRGSSTELRAFLANDKKAPRELVVVVVNKMDTVAWSQHIFADIAQAFLDLGTERRRVAVVPSSALSGANLLESSDRLPWAEITLIQALG